MSDDQQPPPAPDAAGEKAACDEKAGTAGRRVSRRSRRGLHWVNFFLADVQTGVGPFLAIYLAGSAGTRSRSGSP